MIQQKLPLTTLRPKAKPKTPTDPRLAKKFVGEEFTAEFVVKSTGSSQANDFLFVNSRDDFRDTENLTVVLDTKALGEDFHREHIDEPLKYFVGKKLRVRGKVHLRQEKPQILVNDWEQLEFLDAE